MTRVPLLAETLHAMAGAHGDQTAYSVVDGGSTTFDQWDRRASAMARGLAGAGIQPGDRVAIHVSMENALRWMVAYTAVHRAGAVAVPLSPRLAPGEVGRMLVHSGARGLVADGELLREDLSQCGAGGPVRDVALVVDATVPGDATGTDTGTGSGTHADTDTGTAAITGTAVLAWDQVLDAPGEYLQVPRSGDDLADILYTSGTTGTPKGVAVRHANASLVPAGPPNWSGGAWLHASPLCTFAGLGFVYNPMKLGLRGIYQPRFNPARWLEVVASERPVAVFLVPAMTHLLLEQPGFADADLSSIQICAVGSAPLAPFVVERLQEKMPDAMISNNYGMTEAGSVYCLTPKGEAVKRPGSVGQPAPPAQVRIVDDRGHELPVGQVGEVHLKIPGRPREYFGDPEATASTWVDGWLVTGDLGRVDQDGYLYIVGRSKDVIIRGGNNIHAADVEHAIVSHPAVREAAVVGVPHPVLGEDVVAVVALVPGASATPEELRAHCLASLSDYKVPRRWQVVDQLPRNVTGKVVKGELRRLLEGEPTPAGDGEARGA